jgi:hypothetical protein
MEEEVIERTCLICLDGPQPENPLRLLKCGCKTAWFHRSCQMSWIEHNPLSHLPITCPTCKRPVQIQLHYEFHPSFGEAQRQLRNCSMLVAAESFLAICLWFQYTMGTGMDLPEVLLIPCQSIILFYLPNLLHSEYDIMTTMKHVYYKNAIQVLYILFYHFRLRFSSPLMIPAHSFFLVFMGMLHISGQAGMILYSRYTNQTLIRDPFLPLAVSYDTVYVDTLYFVEPPPDPPKRVMRKNRSRSESPQNDLSPRRSPRLADIHNLGVGTDNTGTS